MSDWAERFYPNEGGDPQPPIEPQEPVEAPEESDDYNAQILMSAVSILREDVLSEGRETKEACLGIIQILDRLAHRLNEIETHLVRRLTTLELTMAEDGPDFTNIFDIDPELAQEIRDEAALKTEMGDDFMPELDAESLIEKSLDSADALIEEVPVPSDVVDAYNAWKDPDGPKNGWQTFVKVSGGPVKAKEYRDLIES